MRYIAQIAAVFNWLHERRWALIFGPDEECPKQKKNGDARQHRRKSRKGDNL